ncbi:transporter substrate-binding domain-containing protein [Vibrio sp.]|uniref:transporter substrate-binding domain-containing protein n=1 Tax=Vibrio sp. TaxID=678 RepID=UPI003D1487E1
MRLAVLTRLSLTLTLSLLALPGLAQQVIRVGGDWNYPPYEFINENGLPDGYNTELTYAIADLMGLDVEITLGNWDQMRNQLQSGDIDVMQGMVFSAQRAKNYEFSPPHAIITQSIFARKGSDEITSLEQLRGKKIVVQRGGFMHDFLLQQGFDQEIVLAETHVEALKFLSKGDYPYAIVANLPGLYIEKENQFGNIEVVGSMPSIQRYGYSVLKGNDELLAKFSEGLAILKKNGRQQAIYDKWLGALEQQQMPWIRWGKSAAIAALILSLALAAIGLWNRSLARQVQARSRELEKQHQQLIQADKMTSLGILVSGVAHEINNPTSLLLLNLPMLKDVYQDLEPLLDQHQQQHGDFTLAGLPYSRMKQELPLMLEDMQAGTERIKRIVTDLRDFARQEPDDYREQVDINQVTEAAVRMLDNTIRQSTQQFRLQLQPDLPTFLGSSQRIEQVIINLIVNACQALTSPDQAIAVRSELCRDGWIQLSVRDQGCGIEADNLARLSDPFYTTKREVGGTGLGLSVSSSIVKEHRGELIFDSRQGSGTTVRLRLPASAHHPHQHKK